MYWCSNSFASFQCAAIQFNFFFRLNGKLVKFDMYFYRRLLILFSRNSFVVFTIVFESINGISLNNICQFSYFRRRLNNLCFQCFNVDFFFFLNQLKCIYFHASFWNFALFLMFLLILLNNFALVFNNLLYGTRCNFTIEIFIL